MGSIPLPQAPQVAVLQKKLLKQREMQLLLWIIAAWE